MPGTTPEKRSSSRRFCAGLNCCLYMNLNYTLDIYSLKNIYLYIIHIKLNNLHVYLYEIVGWSVNNFSCIFLIHDQIWRIPRRIWFPTWDRIQRNSKGIQAKGDPKSSWLKDICQVIQFVTFVSCLRSPRTFEFGSRELTIPKWSPAELPG